MGLLGSGCSCCASRFCGSWWFLQPALLQQLLLQSWSAISAFIHVRGKCRASKRRAFVMQGASVAPLGRLPPTTTTPSILVVMRSGARQEEEAHRGRVDRGEEIEIRLLIFSKGSSSSFSSPWPKWQRRNWIFTLFFPVNPATVSWKNWKKAWRIRSASGRKRRTWSFTRNSANTSYSPPMCCLDQMPIA